MRRIAVAVLTLVEAMVACAIFACSLQLSHVMARDATLGHVAHAVVRSAQRIAGVQFSITIGHA
jgi:hypothetical protein